MTVDDYRILLEVDASRARWQAFWRKVLAFLSLR